MQKQDNHYIRITSLPVILERWLETFADKDKSRKVMTEFKKLSADDHSYVDVAQLGRFLKRSSDILDQPDFAIRLALDTPFSVSQDNRSLLFLYYSRTLQDWMRTVMTALPSRGNLFAATLQNGDQVDSSEIVIQITPKIDLSKIPQLAQFLTYDFAKFFLQLNAVSGGGLQHLRVLQSRPLHPGFKDDAVIEWESENFEIVVNRRMLDRPLHVPISHIQDMFSEIFDYLIPHDTDADEALRIQVKILINMLMGTGRCNIEEVAALLNNTAKRLQRALKKNNQSFSTILETARRNAGCDMLANTDVPIKHIAIVLDYSSNKSFALACKRWTGLSPRHYREASREQAPAVANL